MNSNWYKSLKISPNQLKTPRNPTPLKITPFWLHPSTGTSMQLYKIPFKTVSCGITQPIFCAIGPVHKQLADVINYAAYQRHNSLDHLLVRFAAFSTGVTPCVSNCLSTCFASAKFLWKIITLLNIASGLKRLTYFLTHYTHEQLLAKWWLRVQLVSCLSLKNLCHSFIASYFIRALLHPAFFSTRKWLYL